MTLPIALKSQRKTPLKNLLAPRFMIAKKILLLILANQVVALVGLSIDSSIQRTNSFSPSRKNDKAHGYEFQRLCTLLVKCRSIGEIAQKLIMYSISTGKFLNALIWISS